MGSIQGTWVRIYKPIWAKFRAKFSRFSCTVYIFANSVISRYINLYLKNFISKLTIFIRLIRYLTIIVLLSSYLTVFFQSLSFIPTLTVMIMTMSLTPVSSSDEDIGDVPSMQSSYSAGMKRCGICMEERSPLWVRRSKSEETLCRLLITMVEEIFDIRRSWLLE